MDDKRAEVKENIPVGDLLAIGSDGKIKSMPYHLSDPPGPYAPIALRPGDVVFYTAGGVIVGIDRDGREIYHKKRSDPEAEHGEDKSEK